MSTTVESDHPKLKWLDTIREVVGSDVPDHVKRGVGEVAEVFGDEFRHLGYLVGPAVSAQIGVEALNEMLTAKYAGSPPFLFAQQEIPIPTKEPTYKAIIRALGDSADPGVLPSVQEAYQMFGGLATAARRVIANFGEEQGVKAIVSYLQEEVIPTNSDGSPTYALELRETLPQKPKPPLALSPSLPLWEQIGVRRFAEKMSSQPTAEEVIQGRNMQELRNIVGFFLDEYRTLQTFLQPRGAAIIAASTMDYHNQYHHFTIQDQHN